MIVKRGFKTIEERNGFVRKGQSLNANWLYNTDNSRIRTVDPDIRNPLLNVVNFYLPYSYRILNQWLRYYDKFHPLIRNSLNLHSEVPWSDFDLIGIDDTAVKEFYEDMVSDLHLLDFFTASTREFFLIGETIPYSLWDDDLNCFSSLVILNPDYIIIKNNPFTGQKNIYRDFTTDMDLRNAISSTAEEDQQILQDIPTEIIEAAQSQRKLLIDESSVGYIANKTSEYEPRGTSIVLACLKDLLYEDKLREAQYVIAGRHILPIEHWTVGDGLKWMPSEEELADFENLLTSLGNDPLHSLITPAGYNYTAHGVADKILPIIKEFEFIEDRILTAMFTNKSMTHGEGPTFSNAAVAMEILQARYDTVRDKHIRYVKDKLFIPVAEANELYVPSKKEILGHYRVASNLPQLIKDRKEIEQDLIRQQSVLQVSNDTRKVEKEIMSLRCHLTKVIRAIRSSGKRWLIPDFGWLNRVNLKDENQRIQFAFKLSDTLRLPLRKIYELLRLDFDSSMQILKAEKEEYPELYENSESSGSDMLPLDLNKKSPLKEVGDKGLIKDELVSPGLRSPLVKTDYEL